MHRDAEFDKSTGEATGKLCWACPVCDDLTETHADDRDGESGALD